MKGERPEKDLGWLRQISSFASARVILTANHFRIFDHLEGRGKTAIAVSKVLASDGRATEVLLNSLTGLGLIEKKADRYRNTALASKYLVKGKPRYQGDILNHYETLWDNWSGLNTVLKTGRPFRKAHNHESFILGMHNLASLKVKEVISHLDLKGVKRLLDLGGGPGTYSMAFARKKMEVVLFDFPDTLKIARTLIKKAGLEEHIRLLPGDFTKDPLGADYDMIFISQIFHAYTEKECFSMLRKCHDALNSGGNLVIHEFYLNETKTSPLQGALFAVNMLVNTPGGRTYTPEEMTLWLKKTGFGDIKEAMAGDTVLITGAKRKT